MTLTYLDVGDRGRPVDVVIVDPDTDRADAIAEALGAHGVFVAPLTDLDIAYELCVSVGPSLVLFPAELDSDSVARSPTPCSRPKPPTASFDPTPKPVAQRRRSRASHPRSGIRASGSS